MKGDIVIIILHSKETFSLLQRETLSLSSKAICYTNILEKLAQNKKWSVPHWQGMPLGDKVEDAFRAVPPYMGES